MIPPERVAVALDVTRSERALELAGALAEHVGMFKLGPVLYTREGPALVRELVKLGPLFLDLKFHDIPQTVAGAVRASVELGTSLLTVHAAGGARMLEQAATEAREASGGSCRVVAVTVLTSLDAKDLGTLGVIRSLEEQAVALGRMAMEAGCAGVVCAAHEVPAMRRALGRDAFLVTPGIRPAGKVTGDDQRRHATPSEALAAGADLLVVGRPLYAASDPVAAAIDFRSE